MNGILKRKCWKMGGEWRARVSDCQSVGDINEFLCHGEYDDSEETAVADTVFDRAGEIVIRTSSPRELDLLVELLVHGGIAILKQDQDETLSNKVLFRFIECATSVERLEEISDDVDNSRNDAVSMAYQRKLQSFDK